MPEDFYRIKRLPPYVFSEVNALKAQARAAGRDVIDLGMGNPDGPTPPHIVAKLVEAVQNPKTHGYSVSRGIAGLRRACAGYYARRFGVELDPEREVIVTLGSKEGLANLAQAITAPGDIVLVPNPCYPIHAFGFIMAGASIRHVPVGPEFDFLGELKKAVRHSVPAPLAIVLNFPANPTAQTVDLDFYEEIVAFCRRHDIVVLSDIAYAEIYFDGKPPPSILEVPGARDVAVEFSSLSKTYSMAGWRIGFAVGNARLIAALTRVKSYLDYGAFTPDPGRGDRGAQRSAGLYRRNPRALSRAPRCLHRRAAPSRMGSTDTRRDDVRLGADPARLPRDRQPRVLQAVARTGQCGGIAGHRLWRIWRGVRPYRPGREPATPASGDTQHQILPLRPQRRGQAAPPRPRFCGGFGLTA